VSGIGRLYLEFLLGIEIILNELLSREQDRLFGKLSQNNSVEPRRKAIELLLGMKLT
jgi:hypothetical protein